ncbi:MAG TPA: DoxX family membrane protein [Actinomycetota bacterium]|nr:DoxX family membrane protein [Actinomycetota bacterium]
MATKPWHLPLRVATGAFILNSGLSKLDADEERAKQLHAMASTAFPQFADMDPKQFATLLSTGELLLGTALLAVPFVPPLVAGLGLVAFATGLNRLYLKVPGMRQEDSVKPTQQGIPLAKDVWMTAIGAALVLDSIFAPRRRR